MLYVVGMSTPIPLTEDVVADIAACPAPAGTIASFNGEDLPVVGFLFEAVDRYRVNEPVGFSITSFEPKTFHDRVRATGAVHLSRYTRTRIVVLRDGRVERIDETEATISIGR